MRRISLALAGLAIAALAFDSPCALAQEVPADPEAQDEQQGPVIGEMPLDQPAQAFPIVGPVARITQELSPEEQAKFAAIMSGRSLASWDAVLQFAGDLRLGYRGAFTRLLLNQDARTANAMLEALERMTEGQRAKLDDVVEITKPAEWEALPAFLAVAPLETVLAAIPDIDASEAAYQSTGGAVHIAGEIPPAQSAEQARFASWIKSKTKVRISRAHGRATPSTAPWQAQLLTANRSDYSPLEVSQELSTYGRNLKPFERWHTCGAVLIEPDWLLTAAHCIVSPPGTSYISQRNARTGTLGIAGGGTIWRIDRVVRHAGYDPGTMRNDIALLHIAQGVRRASFGNFEPQPIRPAGHGDPQLRGGERVLLTGWGATGDAEYSSDVRSLARTGMSVSPLLNLAWLQVYPAARCNGNRHFIGHKLRVVAGQLCAGAKGQTTTCTGDSGGPLVWTNPRSRNAGGKPERVLVGLVSFAPGCGHADTPSGFVDVRHFADWICLAKAQARPGQVVDWQPPRPSAPCTAQVSARAAN